MLWRAKYDEHPDFKQQYGSDSSSDGFSSDGFRPSRRKLQMRWRLSTKATLKAVKYPGLEFKIKVKAKGTAQRIVRYTRDEEGNPSEALPRLRARQEDLVQDQEQADRRYHR